MNLKDLKARINKQMAKQKSSRPQSGVVVVPTHCLEPGEANEAELARLLEAAGPGGVMLVPVIGDGSLDDWEKDAVESQARLKEDVRK